MDTARFWCGSKKDKRGIHWLKWENVSFAKIEGDWGLETCQALTKPQLLSKVAKVLEARYFKQIDFLNAKSGSNPPFLWRSILWGRQILQKGTRWRVEKGEKIQIQSSNWTPRPTTFRPVVMLPLPVEAKVSALIDPNHQWNVGLIDQNFVKEDVERIKRIPLPRNP